MSVLCQYSAVNMLPLLSSDFCDCVLVLLLTFNSRAGQLQPIAGPHNSLRAHLRATPVYTCTEVGGTECTAAPLFTAVSYATSAAT